MTARAPRLSAILAAATGLAVLSTAGLATPLGSSSASTTVTTVTRADRAATLAVPLKKKPSMGRTTSWVPLMGTKANPGHWDACSGPLTWKIDFTGLVHRKAVALPELQRWKSTFAALGKATGYRFSYLGTGTYPMAAGADGSIGLSGREKDVDIVISYGSATDPGGYRHPQFRAVYGGLAGLGGPQGIQATQQDGASGVEYLDGSVYINAIYVAGLQDPFKRPTRSDVIRSVYLHEVGHVMGLDHTTDRQQTMYRGVQSDVPDRYGAGDLAGLRKLGSMSCFLQPLPQTPAPTTPTTGL